MYVASQSYNLMSPAEVERIHCAALRVLDEMGIEIQSDDLLRVAAGFGLPVDFEAGRVRFPSRLVERFLAEAEKHDWEHARPHVASSAGVYHSLYHDPASGALMPWTEETLASYFALARRLPHVDGASMLGSRLAVPEALEPLYERYHCWKYGAREGGSIWSMDICPFLLELYEALADERGLPLGQVFRGSVSLVPPLKLGRQEAGQVMFFRERGLRVRIDGGMGTMGATAPVTLAGAVVVNLAEQLALRILDWVLFGEKRLHIGGNISVLDMRTSIRPFGRPELALSGMMTAQMARFYGASFSGHAGLSDAKLPSPESGGQKALTAVAVLLAGGELSFDAGLLAMDEVCSPIQMVLDNELLSALKHLAREFQVSDEAIGLETILEAGPGGQYLDRLHTARHFRREHWQPEIWSRQMLQPWLKEGSHLDVDRAREVVLEAQCRPSLSQGKEDAESSGMSEALEREVLRVILRAKKKLAG